MREELRAHVQVVLGRVVLGDIVGVAFGTGRRGHYELALVYPVGEPMEAHVDGFPPLGLRVVVDEADGSGVVNHYWCGWLGVAEFLACGADGAAAAGGFKCGSYLNLHYRAEYNPRDAGYYVGDAVAIGRGGRLSVGQGRGLRHVVDGPYSAAGFGCR